MLTDAHKAEFQAQGYTRVKGLFSAGRGRGAIASTI